MLIGANVILAGILWIFLFLDGIVYTLIRNVYEIFVALAKINIFNETGYLEIVQKVYIVLGVVMLFILAYSLLKAVINPDDFAKGKDSFPKLIMNVVVSLIIITVLPTIFTLAMNIQTAILESDIIPNVILGENSSDTIKNGGNNLAYNTFRVFFHPDLTFCEDITSDSCAESITSNNFLFIIPGSMSLKEAIDKVTDKDHPASFRIFANFSDAAQEGKIDYMFVVSTLSGGFLLFIILIYCIELAVRAVKLIFYQIIAPIPVVARVLPGEKGKKVFSVWLKQTIGTFADVFIRIASMYLGIYLVSFIINNFGGYMRINDLGIIQSGLLIVFVILGIFMFVKQAPNLIKEIFGIELGGTLKTFTDAVSAMAVPTAAIGAGVTAGVQNFNKSLANKRFFASPFSAIGGAVSGAIRGGYKARNAKNMNDIYTAAGAGAKGATAAKAKRDSYRATHYNNALSVGVAHLADAVEHVENWASGGTSRYDDDINAASKFGGAYDAFESELKKLVDKFSSDANIIPPQVDFKGDPNTVKELNDLFFKYVSSANSQGLQMSLSSLNQYIETQKGVTDFSTMVDKSAFNNLNRTAYNSALATEEARLMGLGLNQQEARATAKQNINKQNYLNGTDFDIEGYNDAIEKTKIEHTNKVANLSNMYTQLYKATVQNVGDNVMRGSAIGTITVDKQTPAANRGEEFSRMFTLDGNSVSKVNRDGKVIANFGAIDMNKGSQNIVKQMDEINQAYKSKGSYASAEKAKQRAKNNTTNGSK